MPAGTRLALGQDIHIERDEEVTDAATGASRRLTPRSDNASAPRPEACVYSPNGERLAYVRQVEGWNQVFVVELS